MKHKCRGCRHLMPDRKLLEYLNMPKSAQFFPDQEQLKKECGVDILLQQCPNCGLVQAAGEPVPYFRDVIRATGVSDEMRSFRVRQYTDWVKKYQLQRRRIIEIGCGKGEYMAFMEEAEARVEGLEHLPESLDKGRQAGHVMIEGFIEDETYRIFPPNGREGDSPFSETMYHGFYCMNFLEHIPEPGGFLRGIAANLEEYAVGLVEVPNLDMILEKSLYSEFIQDHLSYFTERTLRGILEQNGFEVIECKTVWYDYIISAEVRKRSFLDVSGFRRQEEHIRMQMKQFLLKKSQEGKKVAVWGAGHQALANLSLLDMAESIHCVIDSADFKQNKYTPATHLPVVAPDILTTNEIQTVIIMAASYSDEIKQIMTDKYPQIEAVILRDNGIEESL